MKTKTGFIKLIHLWGIIFLLAIGAGIIAIDIFISSRHFKIRAEQTRAE